MLLMNTNFIMVGKKILYFFLCQLKTSVNVLCNFFSNLIFGFLLQNIHIIAHQLNSLFTKNKARAWTCITVSNFLIIFKVYNLYDAFYKDFLYDLQLLVYYRQLCLRGLPYPWKIYMYVPLILHLLGKSISA